jgi:hypothetical protein
MEIKIVSFWLPKKGSVESEYEDAFEPRDEGLVKGPSFSFSVTDGATESSFSGLWATLLARAYVENAPSDFKVAMDRAAQVWTDYVARPDLPWFAAEKLREGSFAAFLGLRLTDERGARPFRWQSVAIGDCCLFHVHDDILIKAFPITSASTFSSSPVLIPTDVNLRNTITFLEDGGDCDPGDTFFLMSDALACWCLKELEADEKPNPWCKLRESVVDKAGFDGLVELQRSIGKLRNDDSTLVCIDVCDL